MPITKSAKKSYRASVRKRAHNLILKKNLEKALKKTTKDARETISLIDKAAKIHLISKNKASRLKSRIAKKFEAGEKPQPKASKAGKAHKAKRAK